MAEPDQERTWTLSEALAVGRGEVISFVGGGGKTSAMFRLAAELAGRGWRVITTTTTHIGAEQAALAPAHLVWPLAEHPADELRALLGQHGHVLVTGSLTENGLKWSGIPPEWVAGQPADVVLVEADGAKRLPFKAPATHEPVVPAATTLLVPVVGIDALDRPLAEMAHRPERVAALTGLAPHDPITVPAMAAVLAHPDGGLKGKPAGARVRVLVNKVQSNAAMDAARRLGATLLAAPGAPIEAVLLGAVETEPPILRVERPVAAVVLAAGRSLRMTGDTPKQLLPWGSGTVIQAVVERLASLPLDAVVVVAGHRAAKLREQLRDAPVRTVLNPDYAGGEMLSSLQVGVGEMPGRAAACLVVMADQPWLRADVVQAVLDGYACGPYGVVAPSYEGRRGHPVLIDRRYWPELLALAPGMAPRELLQRHPADTRLVAVPTDSILRDLDTWEDYQRALAEYRPG